MKRRAFFSIILVVGATLFCSNAFADETSSIFLSSASADASNGSAQMNFSGPLNGYWNADCSRYTLRVNGKEERVGTCGCSTGNSYIWLCIYKEFMKPGDKVVVTFQDLHDNEGHTFSGETEVLIASDGSKSE